MRCDRGGTVLGSFFDVTNPMEAAEPAAPASVGDTRTRSSPPGQTPSRHDHHDLRVVNARSSNHSRGALGGRIANRRRDGPGTGKRLCGGRSEPRRGTKPMGEMERPSPGHGGRANQTRRQMKALKSTFTSPGATLYRTRTERRTAGNAPAGLRIGRSAPCGPTMDAIGAIRWHLRTGSDAGSSRRRARAHPRDRSSAHRRRAFGLPGGARARSWPICGAEQLRRPRERPGAPRHRGREPPGARLQEGTGEARASEVGVSRARSRVGWRRASGTGLPLRARFRAVTARRRFDPVGPGGASLTAYRTRALAARGARRVSARAPAAMRGPRRGASSGPVGGRPPDSGWMRRRGPSRMRPPAMRSASSARRRSEPPALTSRAGGPRRRDGRPSPSDAAHRHERPPSSTGQPDGETSRSRPRPQRRSSGSSAGVTTEASTAPAHSRERRRRDPHRSERRSLEWRSRWNPRGPHRARPG